MISAEAYVAPGDHCSADMDGSPIQIHHKSSVLIELFIIRVSFNDLQQRLWNFISSQIFGTIHILDSLYHEQFSMQSSSLYAERLSKLTYWKDYERDACGITFLFGDADNSAMALELAVRQQLGNME